MTTRWWVTAGAALIWRQAALRLVHKMGTTETVNRIELIEAGPQRDDSLIGGIIGAINGGEARGRAVRIPRDSAVTFRLQRALDVGVKDRGRCGMAGIITTTARTES